MWFEPTSVEEYHNYIYDKNNCSTNKNPQKKSFTFKKSKNFVKRSKTDNVKKIR